jgi:2-oxoisovalerate dehydrogenase E1 component
MLSPQGIETRIIDIRWIAPLPIDSILDALKGAKKVLIVDECRETGSQSEAILSMLTEHCSLPTARLAAEDSFIATGPAYAATMPSAESITSVAINLWNDT